MTHYYAPAADRPVPLLPDLRPRNALDLIDASVRLYRRYFGPLLSISALVLLPFGVTYALGGFFYYLSLGPIIGAGTTPSVFEPDFRSLFLGLSLMVLALLIISALGPLSQGALALAISKLYLGRTIGVVEAYRRVMSYWWSLILVGLAFGMLLAVGPLVGGLIGAGLGLPLGFYLFPSAGPIPAVVGALLGLAAGLPVSALFFTWFVLYEQTMIIEGIRGLNSLQRSRSLVTGHGWRVFGTLLLTGVGITLATMILSAPLSIGAMIAAAYRPDLLPHANLLSQCAQQAVNVLIAPVFMIVQTLTYYDLRIRKEGFDLQMMAAAIDKLRPREPSPNANTPQANLAQRPPEVTFSPHDPPSPS